MARPRAEVDEKLLENLASIGCTLDEISLVLEVSKRTLERRFDAAIKRGRAKLCASLRRKQVEQAMAGNSTMLVWLGKQLLGQTDRRDVTTAGQSLPAVRYVWSDGGEVTEPWHETTE